MKYTIFILCSIIGLFLSGCSHTSELTENTQPDIESEPAYMVTYYIHADSGYLYHNPEGKPVRGNSEVLNTAQTVGEKALSGDVMIFYQRPEKKLFGLFPRRSSRLYHYKNGQLINKVNYRHPGDKEAFLATEASLMNQHRKYNRPDTLQNFFFYFGHEIPSVNGNNYHQTLPGINVNTDSFTEGVQHFLSADERFDLVVLSTCNNGTPEVAERLMPFTDLLLASPQNLHLSHFDSATLSLLENEEDISSIQLARLMAEQTYRRLAEDIQTTITISLYDLEKVGTYITPLINHTQVHDNQDSSVQFQDNVDCAEINLPDSSTYQTGVETWYKPARFGRKSGRQSHSGWGCKPGVRSEQSANEI